MTGAQESSSVFPGLDVMRSKAGLQPGKLRRLLDESNQSDSRATEGPTQTLGRVDETNFLYRRSESFSYGIKRRRREGLGPGTKAVRLDGESHTN
jgi:hypothetical protein